MNSLKKITKKIVKKIISGFCIILILVMIWQTKSRFAFLGIILWFVFLGSNLFWNRFFNFDKVWKIMEQQSDKKSHKNLDCLQNSQNYSYQNIDLYSTLQQSTKSDKKVNKYGNLLGNILSGKKLVWSFCFLRQIWFFLVIILPIFIGVVAINLPVEILEKLPVEIAKPSSTFWHGMRTGATLELIQKNPTKWFLGFGLGASGPAAKLEYYDIKKAEIFGQNEQIAYRYRLVGEDLTIPENWFLQVFLNGGIIYFALYLSILCLAVKPLGEFLVKKKYSNINILDNLQTPSQNKKLILNQNSQNNLKITHSILASLAFFGILVGNLFLHIFEAQSIVLYWSLIYLWANLPVENDQKLN